MSIKDELYDAAVAEVRGEASREQKALLAQDIFAWEDALQRVIDEVDGQFVIKGEEFDDAVSGLNPKDRAYQNAEDELENWKRKVRTFKKKILARHSAIKRQCREAGEAAGIPSTELELLYAVVSAAIEFVRAEKAYGMHADYDRFYDEALDALSDVVADYVAVTGES